MSGLELPTFSGPVTAVAINEWLLTCFKRFELFIQDTGKSDTGQKVLIDHAGDKLDFNGDTHDLADWWRNTPSGSIKTWDDFKDELMTQALGSHWLSDAVQTYFTIKQDEKNVDAYIRELSEWRSVLRNSKAFKVSATTLKLAEDDVFKYIMLFNSAPSVCAQVIDNDYDIVTATLPQLRERIRKTSSKSPPGGHQVMTSLSDDTSLLPKVNNDQLQFALEGYILLGYWGRELQRWPSGYAVPARFNDLDNLPANSQLFQRVAHIVLRSSDSRFDSYRLRYEKRDGSGDELINPPNPRASSLKTTMMSLKDGEYISSVTVRRFSNMDTIASLQITTKLPDGSSRSLKSPELTNSQHVFGDARTFTAPSGWQVVGFRGVAYSVSYFDVIAVGLILARLPL